MYVHTARFFAQIHPPSGGGLLEMVPAPNPTPGLDVGDFLAGDTGFILNPLVAIGWFGPPTTESRGVGGRTLFLTTWR